MRTLVLPKVHSVDELNEVSDHIFGHSRENLDQPKPVNIVASIESARALFNVGQIAGWQSGHGPARGGTLTALLVRAIHTAITM